MITMAVDISGNAVDISTKDITVFVAFLVSSILIVRFAIALPFRTTGIRLVNKKKARDVHSTVKTMVVLGSGGHTSEMLRLIEKLDETRYVPLTFVVAQTDHTSEKRVRHHYEKRPEKLAGSSFVYIPRSREVGQGWPSSAAATARALVVGARLILGNDPERPGTFPRRRRRPDLLLCNGPGTCIPIAGLCFLGNMLFGVKTKIVFVESFCRVKTLSLSGKIMYPFADRFIVHWPELQQKFHRSEYIGHI
mmetsp:Transcript_5666/g.9170  ORF Transcript_5666/g.9170 Transcript_5666/m.9170 type:complete len:250 (-) Transcript_5666:214-963(-)